MRAARDGRNCCACDFEFSATLVAEFWRADIGRAALRTFDRRSTDAATALLLLLRLVHGVRHLPGHLVAYSEARAKTCADACAARRILCGIAHGVCGLKLRVASNVSDDAHRGAPVHCGFDLWRQRDVFDEELGQFQSVRLELLVQLVATELAQLVIFRCKVERRDFRFTKRVCKTANESSIQLPLDAFCLDVAACACDLFDEGARVRNTD